jgi:hypothetical protein
MGSAHACMRRDPLKKTEMCLHISGLYAWANPHFQISEANPVRQEIIWKKSFIGAHPLMVVKSDRFA